MNHKNVEFVYFLCLSLLSFCEKQKHLLKLWAGAVHLKAGPELDFEQGKKWVWLRTSKLKQREI